MVRVCTTGFGHMVEPLDRVAATARGRTSQGAYEAGKHEISADRARARALRQDTVGLSHTHEQILHVLRGPDYLPPAKHMQMRRHLHVLFSIVDSTRIPVANSPRIIYQSQ